MARSNCRIWTTAQMEAILDKDKQLSKDINYENYKEVLALAAL